MTTPNTEVKKPENDIRIGMNTRPKNVIKYATSIMDEKKLKEIKLSAVGGSIGRLIEAVEVLKVTIGGLYQQNKLSSVTYQTVDGNKTVIKERLYPKLEVILSKEPPKNKNEGTQDVIDENLRKEIEKIMKERREKMESDERGGVRRGWRARRGFRGRRGFRRGFRGGFRGGFRRGFRGGFRGQRGFGRGGDKARAGFRGRGRGSPQRGNKN